MKIREILDTFDSLVPFTWQEEYDNSGLLIGDPGKEITSILVTLDVTPDVVKEALDQGCNLILTHHPVMFRGIRNIVPGSSESEVLILSIKHDIAIIALHTNLDNAFNGLNGYLMRKLGIPHYSILVPKTGLLSKLVTFCPASHAEMLKNSLFNAGAGHIGKYDCCSYSSNGVGTFRASEECNPYVGEKNVLHSEKETRIEVIFPEKIRTAVLDALLKSHPYEEVAYDIYPLTNDFAGAGAGIVGDLPLPVSEDEFLTKVKDQLKISHLRHSPRISRMISRVAVCSGSGVFLIKDAIRAGADIFLTADLKYHDFFLADGRINLCDIGHYESECGVKEWLTDMLNEKFPNFAVFISKINTNPVSYF